ncbi:MAG: ABC transporter ATP-binding protein [Alicyclobacillus sp.]|nr:ABC transporter ATP-binding protein [Alicyclobacillus sp.]
MNDTVLEVQDLHKTYGKTAALQGATFSVQAGSCFGLLGPNGAGKSTTMKVLTGIIQPDRGETRVLGLRPDREPGAVRKRIGYVPQEITLYDKLSARDNLAFFGELYGVPRAQLPQRIREVLRQIGLENRGGDLVGSFSGGMKRRVNIAAALLHHPQLLILDEPTVGIDPQSRNHIFGIIRSLKQDGVTVIYSTHYMEEVESLCDHLAILDHGRVIAEGSLHDVLALQTGQAVYVEFDAASASRPLPSLPGVRRTTSQGGGFLLETDDPVQCIRALLDWAAGQAVNLCAIEMVRPSLESVFLSLTGTNLRD